MKPDFERAMAAEETKAPRPNRVAQVNKYLRSLGRTERLRKGNGYYYFTDGARFESVMSYRANDLTWEMWKHIVDDEIAEAKAGRR